MTADEKLEAEAELYCAMVDALEAYAKATGDRVTVKVRPQRGQNSRVRVDLDFNDPRVPALSVRR